MKVIQNGINLPLSVDTQSNVPLRVGNDNETIHLKARSSDGEVISLRASTNTGTVKLDTDVSLVVPGTPEGDIYEGPYIVNPAFRRITLSTKNKILTENINVTPIDVQRVSNLSGGKTVYIGGVING